MLRECPDLGRTIIEKFEDEAKGADFVFVLLTPDDKAGPKRYGGSSSSWSIDRREMSSIALPNEGGGVMLPEVGTSSWTRLVPL